MALQPAPKEIRDLLGGAYKWLTKLIHDLSNIQTSTNTALFVSGLTVQNNTPSGGKITWSACEIFFQGIAYIIAAGTTPNSEQFVLWTVGQNVFTVANNYTPSPTTFVILTNNQGTVDTAWDKIAAVSVQAQLLDSVLTYDGPNGSLILTDIVFSDNSPGAGMVSWTAGTASYQHTTYQISSGSSAGPNIAICWKLSSPSQIQALPAPATLGADDFLLGFNNPSGSPSALGFFSRTIRFLNRPGSNIIISDTGISGANKNNNSVFSMQRQAADGPFGAAGNVFVFDGTGSVSQTQVALKGNIPNGGGNVAGLVFTRPSTFAQLPTTPVQGDRAMITDGAAFSFGAIAAGGGTVIQPVFYDGTNWRQG